MYISTLVPYVDCKIYGPYKRKDGREHVVVIKPNGVRTTVSYPKFIYETETGNKLATNQTIDHYDCDVSNNAGDNIFPIPRSEHCSMDAIKYMPQSFVCEVCGTRFELDSVALSTVVRNRKRRASPGPFCGRSCAGKATHNPNQYKQHPINPPERIK